MALRILTILSETRVPFIRGEVINAMTSRVSLAREQVLRLNVGQPSHQKNTQSFSILRARDLPIFQRPSFYHRHSVFLITLRKRNYAPLGASHVQRRYYSTHQSSNKEGLLVSTKRYFGTFCGIGALALATTALFCACLFGNEQDKSGEPQILETAFNQALKERKFEEARQLLNVSPETEINDDSLNIALQTGDLMLICDLIEAGAKPNQDSLICAALSAPVFIPYILNHLKAEGIDVKGTLTARYGEIVMTNPTTEAFDEATSQRIKLLETNQFWKTVWVSRKRQQENPNFHLPTVKTYLTEYLSSHEGISNIFVPFCGKSVDMYYLQQVGYHVVGADLSDEATDDFFVEHGLEFTKTKSGSFIIKTAKVDKGSITLICGDLLKLTTEHLKNVDLVYDRAGYNSVPLSVRLSYSNLLSERLPEKTKILMGFLDIEPKDPKLGPPYYISDEELGAFKKRFDLTVKKESRSEFFAS